MAYKDLQKRKEHFHQYYLKNKERDRIKRRTAWREWARKNKVILNERKRNQRETDPEFRRKAVERSRLWRIKHPKEMALAKRKSRLKHLHGLTLLDYQKMFDFSRGGCYVCGFVPQNTSAWDRLCVDHNHKTGKNRGLLCHSCNRSLGLLGDDIERLKKLIKYLQKYAI